MFPKMSVGVVLASAIAMAPLSFSRDGLARNDSLAGNGATSYFTLKPGASKTFTNGSELRVCHDDGPPVAAHIDPEGTRRVSGGMCVYSTGRILTLTNDSSSPVTLHSSSVQKSGGAGRGHHH